MRAVAWVSALLLLAGLATEVVLVVHGQAAKAGALTASRQQSAAGLIVADTNYPQTDPPHVIPAPSPSPVPTSAPPAARPPATGGSAPVRTRPATIVIGSKQQALINQDRASRGLPPLNWSSCLDSVAIANARRIAAQGYLSHTNGPQMDLTCHLGNHAGENIGYWSLGINDTQINSMFMNSPEHYANIMGPYHYVATAWVVASNGYGYIAVEFS